jgi:hypothetical protein
MYKKRNVNYLFSQLLNKNITTQQTKIHPLYPTLSTEIQSLVFISINKVIEMTIKCY